MLQFTPLSQDAIDYLRPYFADGAMRAGRNCDCTVIGTFMWRDYFKTQYSIFNGSLVLKVQYFGGIDAFTMPLCGGRCRETLMAVAEYAREENMPLAFCAVDEEDFTLLREVFGELDCATERAWSDYVYDARDLSSLAGRKYSGQRNHINKFRKLYPRAAFEEIGAENSAEAAAFIRRSGARSADFSPLAHEEAVKAVEVAENFELYRPLAGLIRVDGQIAAASYGEVIGDTLFVHIEKADLAYEGVYPVIVQEFSSRYASQYAEGCVKNINRGEDDGVEGLRTVKLSYHPSRLIDKYLVRVPTAR